MLRIFRCQFRSASLCLVALLCAPLLRSQPRPPAMYFVDTSRLGVPFAKDPSVVDFNGRFLMYYSLPASRSSSVPGASEQRGWGISIAESQDLVHWAKVGELPPTQPIEKDGIAAPGARVIHGAVHLFYQTYGQGPKDAICHAVSLDGVHFVKDAANPVYRPQHMAWSVGRAIDADVLPLRKDVYLYFATRDPGMVRQLIGMAKASTDSKLSAGDWTDVSMDGPVLQPTLSWERQCIEAPSVIQHGGEFYMFYAGGYNNEPQQIGVARSADAVRWTRVSEAPLLANGGPGDWNHSESGHPGALIVGARTFLFFQGDRDGGRTYFLSKVEIGWHGIVPYVIPESAGATARPASRPSSHERSGTISGFLSAR